MRRLAAAALLTCCAVATAVGAEERILLERSEVLEAIRGRVDIRKRLETPVALPAVDCPEARSHSCLEERTVQQLYALDLFRETLRPERDASDVWQEELIGRFRIAADLDNDGDSLLTDELNDALAGLHARAFLQPRAGWGTRFPLVDGATFPSGEPAWICVEDEVDLFELFLHRRVDQHGQPSLDFYEIISSRDTGFSLANGRAAACPTIFQAFPETLPVDRRVRTSTAISQTRMTRVSASLDWSRSEQRRPHPTAVLLGNALNQRRPEPRGQWTYLRSPQAQFDAIPVIRSELPLPELESSGFALELIVERWVRGFGANPADSTADTERLTLFGLPVDGIDPNAPDKLPERFGEALLDDLGGVLDRDTRLTARQAARTLIREKRESLYGWLLVLCDGGRDISAYMPPLPSRIEVSNGAEFCRAAGDVLDR